MRLYAWQVVDYFYQLPYASKISTFASCWKMEKESAVTVVSSKCAPSECTGNRISYRARETNKLQTISVFIKN